jgi:ketosteroid isomerase-like protein
MNRLQVVRDCYDAFARGDRAVVERHFADAFTFSAPPDVGIDRATFFERCWPHSGSGGTTEYARLFEHGDEVVVTYITTRANGTRFQNTEIFGFDGEHVTSQEVYFGWDLD